VKELSKSIKPTKHAESLELIVVPIEGSDSYIFPLSLTIRQTRGGVGVYETHTVGLVSQTIL
jgi:hypothetical protein